MYTVSWFTYWYTNDSANEGRDRRSSRDFDKLQQAFLFRDRLLRLSQTDEDDMSEEDYDFWWDQITDCGAGYFNNGVTVSKTTTKTIWQQKSV